MATFPNEEGAGRAQPDDDVVVLLDAIPGLLEGHRDGLADLGADRVVPLAELRAAELGDEPV